MVRPTRMQYALRTLALTSLLFAAAPALGPLAPNASPGTHLAEGRLAAQDAPPRLEVRPASIEMVVGESTPIAVTIGGASLSIDEVALRFAAPRRALRVSDGTVRALEPGDWEIVVTGTAPEGMPALAPVRVPVTVRWPAVARGEITPAPGALHVGTRIDQRYRALHADGSERPEARPEWRSSDPEVVRVDAWGRVEGIAPGTATVSALFEGVESRVTWEVSAIPESARLEITEGVEQARTGDVVRLSAAVHDGARRLTEVPIAWSVHFTPDDSIRAPGAAGIVDGGAFVGEVPGRYDVIATAGSLVARHTIDVRPRDVVQQVERLGQGSVSHVHTSDLWVYEGVDGRDYAVTGTWGGNGVAYFWDVTDPGSVQLVDSITVDARTVNDVKVAPNGRWAALSREGASNRRNGVVIVDLTAPRSPVVATEVDDHGLTGGVHNMFATDTHLFALAGGDKYVILDMTDPAAPRYVSEYDHPDSRIHDVWVHDGIAYSSEWGTGVVVVDVGNGRWGGTIENPVFVTNVPYPVGATHAAFPYVQESTGKVYLFLGDEILNRRGAAWEGYGSDSAWDPETGEGGVQSPSSGYIHIIDFTDPENPVDVARYEVPEFGTHNLWVEDDVMYVAYYEGGLRVVDVSGELMGNLATQGREIAVSKAFDPFGYMANQPNAWGPQPYKGHVFYTDFNSGLWSIRLVPRERTIF